MSTIKGKINITELSDSLRTKIEKVENKVEKEAGKGLSECDFTQEYKNKLDNEQPNTYVHPDTHPASMITVSNPNFTNNNLDEVLNELFINADNGQKSISEVIGSPLSASDNLSTMKTKIENIKKTMATNLTTKGQNSTYTESLNNLANKINNISIGDYKIGDKIPINKFTYNYSPSILSTYKKEANMDITSSINTNNSLKVYLDKKNNIIIQGYEKTLFYNYSNGTFSTVVSDIPSSTTIYNFYDEKNDQYYVYYGDYTYLYIHKINSWTKKIYCQETDDKDCLYRHPSIYRILVDHENNLQIHFSIFYSASGVKRRWFKINTSGTSTSIKEISYISSDHNIVNIPNTTNYFDIDTDSERILEYDSSGSIVQTIQLTGLLKSTKLLHCINKSALIIKSTQNSYIYLLNLDKKEIVKTITGNNCFIVNNKEFVTNELDIYGQIVTKIKKYSYTNTTMNLIYEMTSPENFHISYGSFNGEKAAFVYNKLLYLYKNTENILSSITLK